jgi:hypothetical protein
VRGPASRQSHAVDRTVVRPQAFTEPVESERVRPDLIEDAQADRGPQQPQQGVRVGACHRREILRAARAGVQVIGDVELRDDRDHPRNLEPENQLKQLAGRCLFMFLLSRERSAIVHRARLTAGIPGDTRVSARPNEPARRC